jgi:hypothetical protein
MQRMLLRCPEKDTRRIKRVGLKWPGRLAPLRLRLICARSKFVVKNNFSLGETRSLLRGAAVIQTGCEVAPAAWRCCWQSFAPHLW